MRPTTNPLALPAPGGGVKIDGKILSHVEYFAKRAAYLVDRVNLSPSDAWKIISREAVDLFGERLGSKFDLNLFGRPGGLIVLKGKNFFSSMVITIETFPERRIADLSLVSSSEKSGVIELESIGKTLVYDYKTGTVAIGYRNDFDLKRGPIVH